MLVSNLIMDSCGTVNLFHRSSGSGTVRFDGMKWYLGQSHLSYMVQWDRTDRWDVVGPGGTWDSIGQSHLSYMVQ